MSDVSTLVDTLRHRGIVDERVLSAIGSVDRAKFVPPEWKDRAWEDVALPIGSGQTISQPYIVALMTEALALWGDEVVLEIGTGSGYQAAILSRLCRRLITIERRAELADRAKAVLGDLGSENITWRIGDGSLGAADDGPFDGILVTAAAPAIPLNLYEQLVNGGRMVLPIGPEDEQSLVLVEKTSQGPSQRALCGCRFVKLIGAQGWSDDDAGGRP